MSEFPPFTDDAERILKCASIEDVWELHLEKMQMYGFDRLLYSMTNFRTHGMWGGFSDILLMSNHDREVIDTITHWGLNHKAAVVPRENFSPGAHSWRDFQEGEAAGELNERDFGQQGGRQTFATGCAKVGEAGQTCLPSELFG